MCLDAWTHRGAVEGLFRNRWFLLGAPCYLEGLVVVSHKPSWRVSEGLIDAGFSPTQTACVCVGLLLTSQYSLSAPNIVSPPSTAEQVQDFYF